MKNLILILVLLLIPVSAAAADDYYYNHSGTKMYSRQPDGSYFNNDYGNPVTYDVRGKNISGSDGSSYTIHNNILQNNNTAESYVIEGNIIRPMHPYYK